PLFPYTTLFRSLAADLLEDVGDRHPRRDRMRVDDQIRDDPLGREGHYFLRGDAPDDALLPVPRGELVPQLGHPQVPHLDLGELRTVLAFREHDGVDPAVLAVPHRDGGLAALLRRQEVRLLLEESGRARLPDEDVAAI